jgi:hypothetical protein
MPKLVDLSGKRFGRLLVVERAGSNIHGSAMWKVRCDCGTVKLINGGTLRLGDSNSCGCLNKDQKKAMCIERNSTHGMAKTKTYKVWNGMLQRCGNPKSSGFHKYGARGIKVCEHWNLFENFYADMGDPPSPKHTLDRINPKGNYCPENCRWTTQKVQQNNRSNNRLITFKGRTKTLQQWSIATGMNHKTLSRRLDKWGVDRALSTPKPDSTK